MAPILRSRYKASITQGENMIIVPPSYHLREHGEFQFGSKSFLMADVQNSDVSVRCVTGKLPNGVMSSTRKKIIESLLALNHMDTSLLAFDTNFLFPFEKKVFVRLLQQYGFSATSHT